MNDDELMKAVKEQQKEYLKKRDKIFAMMFLGISIILTGTSFDDIPPLEKFLSVIGFGICILSIIKYMWFLNGGSQKKATGQAEKSFHRLGSRILCIIFVLVNNASKILAFYRSSPLESQVVRLGIVRTLIPLTST